MIRSKIDKLQETRLHIRFKLECALSTKRGTKEARNESYNILQNAIHTGVCQACGDALHIATSQNPYNYRRFEGYCSSCQARFSRMLNFKSKIKRELPKSLALQRFITDYKQTDHLPYSLRGAAPREDILKYAEDLLVVTKDIEKEMHEALAWRREHVNLMEDANEDM